MTEAAPRPSLLAPLIAALGTRDDKRIAAEAAQVTRAQPAVAEQLFASLAEQLYQRGQIDLLLHFYVSCIQLFSDPMLNAMLPQAQTLTDRGLIREAITILELLNARDPDNTGVMQQLARRFQMMGEDEKALALLHRVLTLDPNQTEGRFMHVVARMIKSRFADGLDEYDVRFALSPEAWRPTKAPRWRGEKLGGKRLYIWGEQGIGDTVMYGSFLPNLLAQNPLEICMGVAQQMVPLMQRSFPEVRFVAHYPSLPHEEDDAPYDFALPLADVLRYCLPHYLPREHPPILAANPVMLAEARASLKSLGARRLIGVSWFTTNQKSAVVRNVPLEQWAPIFSAPGCTFFSLQHGDGVKDMVEHAARAYGFPLFVDPHFNPMADTDKLTALTAAMDEIITIQATAGHLGGGLGLPTTILCSKAKDFSWAWDPCPWYASVYIERQETALEWTPMIARVAEGLRERMKNAA